MTKALGVSPSHTMLTVSDYDRSVEFYTKALGFSLGFERTDSVAFEPILQLHDVKLREAFLRHGSAMIGLIAYESPETLPAANYAANRIGIVGMAFIVEDIDAAAQRVIEHGGNVFANTRYVSKYGTQLLAADPDGIRLELVQRVT